jgi:hypothetical protein
VAAMRQAVKVAKEMQRIAHGVEPGRLWPDRLAKAGPLFPSVDGTRMKKEAAAACFADVTRHSGTLGRRITGHSPRCSGAQRAAAAGISDWRIQVFGRWGSAATLGYLRESLLQYQGVGMAYRIEKSLAGKLDLAEVEDSATQLCRKLAKPTGGGAPPSMGAVQIAVTDAVAEVALEGGPTSQIAERVANIVQEMRGMKQTLQTLEGLRLPTAARSATGRIHLVRDASRAWCGFRWGAMSAQTISAAEAQESAGQVCRTCSSRAKDVQKES